MENVKTFIWKQVKAVKPAFVSKNPNFNFITAHYFWIIGCTILGSILFYSSGRGKLAYIDSLLFASGANTQAGLNPVDVNQLNTFQQTLIYIFALASNPITLHSCVVFLRLYWFEKRFQGWVREIRQRRPTFTKSKSKAFTDQPQPTELGVNGRNITVVPANGRNTRITNDGILLEDERRRSIAQAESNHDESEASTMMGDVPKPAVVIESTESSSKNESHSPDSKDDSDPSPRQSASAAAESPHGTHTPDHHTHHTAITFADTVKRSDGLEDEVAQPPLRSNAEHIAILERQRNEDRDEVLRIPGPRDAERGLVPRRIEDHDPDDDEEPGLARLRTADSRVQHGTDPRHLQGRQPTITIAEPEKRHHPHHHRDEIIEEAKVVGSTFDSIRFRKPRIFNHNQHKFHEDDEEEQEDNEDEVRTQGGTFRSGQVSTRALHRIRSVLSREKTEDMPYLSYTPTIGRNSNFVGLTLEQREELGGIEYRSLRTLALVLLFYFWGFQLIGLSCLLPYILHKKKYRDIVQSDGISPTWWGFFTANLAFMDVGFTLTPDSMYSFVRSEFVLMIMAFLIVIGNTGFPVMLRFIIWTLTKIVPTGSGLWEELKFLLDHPRRCFTLLFPSGPNWWLFWILVLLNGVDLLFFMVLDLNADPINQYPVHNRIVIGLFQAASTRTAGFAAISLGDLNPGMPVLYMIMMYISVFPIAISIRRTNVYEEKSLGVYHTGDDEDGAADANALSYVGTHLRRQLSFDLWFVFLGFFVLSISEGSKIKRGEFDLFSILFEVVSAYGTVGLSMGAAGVNASLCSQFTVVGKLVIVAMQIRGRHRGLPYGLDRAVILPSEARFKKEAEEAEATLARINTRMSRATTTTGFQRHHSMGNRGRSLSRERTNNTNLITQFLHPGPVVQRDAVLGHQRNRSTDSGTMTLEPKRTNTAPVEEETELEQMPSSTSSRIRPHRTNTSPILERSPWRQ